MVAGGGVGVIEAAKIGDFQMARAASTSATTPTTIQIRDRGRGVGTSFGGGTVNSAAFGLGRTGIGVTVFTSGANGSDSVAVNASINSAPVLKRWSRSLAITFSMTASTPAGRLGL